MRVKEQSGAKLVPRMFRIMAYHAPGSGFTDDHLRVNRPGHDLLQSRLDDMR
jgi:hypothetical protein